MTKRVATPRWMSDFAERVRCSPSFLREMHTQLSTGFRAKTGLDIDEFVLAPAVPDIFTVRSNGLVAFVQVAVVSSSNVGFPANLAWMDRAQQRLIKPTESVTEQGIKFWWHGLPVDLLVADHTTWPDPPFDVTRFPFEIDYRLKVWPHVRFTIAFHERVDEVRRGALETSFIDLVSEWLARGGPGTIHEAGPVTRIDERTLALDVDLGSAGPDGMIHVLERFAAFGGVARVQIRASASGDAP